MCEPGMKICGPESDVREVDNVLHEAPVIEVAMEVLRLLRRAVASRQRPPDGHVRNGRRRPEDAGHGAEHDGIIDDFKNMRRRHDEFGVEIGDVDALGNVVGRIESSEFRIIRIATGLVGEKSANLARHLRPKPGVLA